MPNFAAFGLRDMTECGAALRKLGEESESMEDAANRLVRYFYEAFVDEVGQRSLALVRLFKTHPYHDLTPELRAVVQQTLGGQPESPRLKCLTLLATVGEQADWNSRSTSRGHQAIPLVSEELVAQSPMISQLIQQMGLEIGAVLEPDPTLVLSLEQRTFNVFHVSEAKDSPFVPAQADFVVPYGICSVLGFGSMLPSGNLLATIMFSKTSISRDTADMFKTLALNAKLALLPFDGYKTFSDGERVSCK